MIYERWDMKDKIWEMSYERWEMRNERWGTRDEIWEMRYERWDTRDEIRYEMAKDMRWDEIRLIYYTLG